VWEGRIQGSGHTERARLEAKTAPTPWPYLKKNKNKKTKKKQKKKNCFKPKSGGKRTYLQPSQCSTLTFSFWKSRLPPPAECPPTPSSTKGFPQFRHSASFIKM
jgi:predicted Zn-ribbon and HTH transcriptional regulator